MLLGILKSDGTPLHCPASTLSVIVNGEARLQIVHNTHIVELSEHSRIYVYQVAISAIIEWLAMSEAVELSSEEWLAMTSMAQAM